MKNSVLKKIFGEYVCDDHTLKRFMPLGSFCKYKKLKNQNAPLDTKTAKYVAKAIKHWAFEKGATHYSHWFMPLNGRTAEKQVSFVEIAKDGKMIEDFDEKSLIKGETDASSFPNGGERMTFEARGYTVWDYTSPVFIKEDSSHNKVVYIPTAFCSYNGTALDEKTPLLRAIDSLNTQAVRILHMLGYKNVKRVDFFTGAEQEYFLVKSSDYIKRTDLKMLDRTILGSAPLKSQNLCSHYYGMIEDKISTFMNDVDRTLWKMGVAAKHQHNEVAPSQFEFVPMFSLTNISADQNQLIMEVIKTTAQKYGFNAIFEEKPFSNINGSGKHANWSISTDTGINLFDSEMPDKTLFFTFFTSVIAAIDRYGKLMKFSVSSRGNDLRLGGDEAPPAIVSVFASDYILQMYKNYSLEKNVKKLSKFETGANNLPVFYKDYCDRNRTSPFAYTGNKFEFRMLGSSASISFPSTCFCMGLSQVLKEIADKVESQSGNKRDLVKKAFEANFELHKKIIFNGNGYDKSWENEAKKRGLPIYHDSLTLFENMNDKNIINGFISTKILSEEEFSIRLNNAISNYTNTVCLEAKTMINMFRKHIFASFKEYLVFDKSNTKFSTDCKLLQLYVSKLEDLAEKTNSLDTKTLCKTIKTDILPAMAKIRSLYDQMEKVLPERFEPFPTYNNILFN